MSYVVAVAGPPGGGKSTLVQALVARLGDACALHMDDYERMTRRPVAEVSSWAARGADFDELEVPLLAEHLRRLKGGEPVTTPAGGRRIAPRKYIVFETQFGRAHRPTGALIDLLVWIDVSPEVALARKLRTLIADALGEERPGVARERLAALDDYLASYLALVRGLLQMQLDRVRPQADVIVDSNGELEPMIARAREQVLRRLS